MPKAQKTDPVSFRLEPKTKRALDKAAKADQRSISSLLEKIVTDHLRATGYLE